MATGAGPHLPIEVPMDVRQEAGDVAGYEQRHDETHRGLKGRPEWLQRTGADVPTGGMRRNENL